MRFLVDSVASTGLRLCPGAHLLSSEGEPLFAGRSLGRPRGSDLGGEGDIWSRMWSLVYLFNGLSGPGPGKGWVVWEAALPGQGLSALPGSLGPDVPMAPKCSTF